MEMPIQHLNDTNIKSVVIEMKPEYCVVDEGDLVSFGSGYDRMKVSGIYRSQDGTTLELKFIEGGE